MISNYFMHIGIIICIYVILVTSLNIAFGYAGLLSLANIAFYGIGAYVSALFVMQLGVPYLFALIMAGVIAGLFAALLAIPTSRLRGDYLALATLGFAFLVDAVLKNWTSLTRGPLGIPGIPKPVIFGFTISSQWAYLVFAFVVMVICLLLIVKLMKSPFGRLLGGIRDDERGARSLGKNLLKNKALALGLSGFFAGIAGSVYAHYITFIDPTTFSIMEMILIVSMLVMGGLASTRGAMIGAVILVVLPEPLRFLGFPSSFVGPARQMIYALVLIVIMIYWPKGLFGKIKIEEPT